MIRSFNGKTPKIAESAFVSEAAYVIGDVEIGENSSVWPGAVIRGDFGHIKIGANTSIQDNSVVHDGALTEVGDNVLIAHCVVVHGRKIGNNTIVGDNATILDESEIGSFCLIGAGSLVSQGMKIPDNSFVVGVPAKIKRQISAEQRLRTQGWYQVCLEKGKQYKHEGL